MRSIPVALLLVVMALGLPVKAAEKADAIRQYVDLTPLALPVITQGKLRNYVFVTVRLNLSPRVDPMSWGDKEPYFRDALVRAGHRTPFSSPKDWMHLDEAALKRSMMAEAGRIAGPGVVTSVELLKATPQRRALAPQS